MAIKASESKLTEEQLYSPDLDEGVRDVETYLVPDGESIEDPYLREAWNIAANFLNGIKQQSTDPNKQSNKLREKSLFLKYRMKGGGTCKQGERSDLTGCTPATKDPTKQRGSAANPQPVQQRTEPNRPKSKEEIGKPIDGTDGFEQKKKMVGELHDTFISSLSKEERRTIKRYTSGELSYDLNDSMRRCPPEFACVQGDDKEVMNQLESILEKAPKFPEPIALYRGISITDPEVRKGFLQQLEKNLESGSEFTMPSFTSTGLAPLIGFAGTGDSFVLQIVAKSGLYVESISDNEGEFEVIQSPKTKYKVVGITQEEIPIVAVRWGKSREIGRRVIYLEEV